MQGELSNSALTWGPIILEKRVDSAREAVEQLEQDDEYLSSLSDEQREELRKVEQRIGDACQEVVDFLREHRRDLLE